MCTHGPMVLCLYLCTLVHLCKRCGCIHMGLLKNQRVLSQPVSPAMEKAGSNFFFKVKKKEESKEKWGRKQKLCGQ